MGASIDLAVWVKEARTFASKTQDDLAPAACGFSFAFLQPLMRLFFAPVFRRPVFSKLNPIENQQNIAKSTKI